MGVILKYQIDFPDVGFKVSNDLHSGDFIIDADVRAEMARGSVGSQFSITLYDLPQETSEQLSQQVQSAKLGKVKITLGYMDGSFEPVMEGLYSKVVAAVEGDRFVTTVNGLETGTHALQNTFAQNNLGGTATISDAVAKLLKEASIKEGEIDRKPDLQSISQALEDPALRGKNLIEILDDLARRADAELLVCDKKVRMGKPIRENTYSPDPFSYEVNLAVFRPFIKKLPSEDADNRLEKLPPAKGLGFKFTIAGDPKLRPAHKVLAKVKGFDNEAGIEFRVHSIVHTLSTGGGYTCDGVAMSICTGDNCRRLMDATARPNADAIVQSFAQRIKDESRRRPSLEIAQVKEYSAGSSGQSQHRSTLYYGQRYAKNETQPSVRAEVENEKGQLLRNRPILSPFAWHKCGLVVPVYRGMKAMLSHNLGLPEDALVNGFLWSEKPTLEPPKNQTGDWWLCLPIDIDVKSASPPPDSTKAANDLTSGNGKRVIEVKGLKISVGAKLLKNIGERPSEGNDDEFLIEHKSGTKFQIASDGSLSIEAKRISIKGDVTIEGSVEVK